MAASSIIACPQCGTKNRVPAAASGSPRCPSCKTTLPWIVDADDSDVGPVVNDAKVPVVVDLWAPWCGPCRAVSPALEQLARDFAGRIKLVKVNVDEAPGTQARFGVQGIPTLVMVVDGVEVSRQVGAAGIDHLRAWIEQGLAGS